MARGLSGARIIVIFAALSVALFVAAGPALARTFICAAGQDCTGTNKADKITGEGANTIDGKRGNDTITSVQSIINGNGGNDTLLSRGATEVRGGGGNDTLEEIESSGSGGPPFGGNLLDGGSGDDKIIVRFGESIIEGGGGRDVIRAQNGQADGIDCGGGKDTVTFDEGLDDVADNCEKQNP
jgi:Ca2+-binding RTX toxin-like protein